MVKAEFQPSSVYSTREFARVAHIRYVPVRYPRRPEAMFSHASASLAQSNSYIRTRRALVGHRHLFENPIVFSTAHTSARGLRGSATRLLGFADSPLSSTTCPSGRLTVGHFGPINYRCSSVGPFYLTLGHFGPITGSYGFRHTCKSCYFIRSKDGVESDTDRLQQRVLAGTYWYIIIRPALS